MSTDQRDKMNLEDSVVDRAEIPTRIPPPGSIAPLEENPISPKNFKSDPPQELVQIAGYTFIDLLHDSERTLVYLAREEITGRDVAIKQFRKEKEFTQEKKIQEIIINSKKEYHHLLLAYNFIEEQKTIISPYLRGGNLHALSNSLGPLKARQTWVIAADLLTGLQDLHDLGMVYRDVKSRNAVVGITDPNLEKITAEGLESFTDFNLKWCDFESVKHPGIPDLYEKDIIGTPRYMAPEVCRGEKYDLRSDIYGTGIILCRLVTGKYPFDADNFLQIVQRQIHDEFPDSIFYNTEITPGQKEVLKKSLAKDPEHRYQSAEEFRWAWSNELITK